MKVAVRGFLTLKKVMDAKASIEFEDDYLTVDGLLQELSVRYGKEFEKMLFDSETHALSRHIRILINGRHYTHLPDRLNTQLREGDEVCLFPPVAGG